MQHECADAFRGRVFAVSDTTFNLAYVLGMVAASRFIPDDARSPVLLGVAAAGYGCLAGRVRNCRRPVGSRSRGDIALSATGMPGAKR
ncbi:hypothetical protein ACFFMR_15270 [Micromonospora andamanensis]|uniref:MFS transporter n=1 Tax=Micromonospora andamanensis TaxID=1287068 RepID=A0ABQ4HY88_9ACTN|nr:hypothetical protein [Micromonospora andamanensis]GIJ10597.1 hypothetical protein Van01_38110 [Micromonospora andamanensis]